MSAKTTYAFGLFVAGWVLTAFLTPYFIRLGKRWSVLDEPGERKVHDQPIPRTGGMAIYTSIAIVTLIGILLVPPLTQSFFRDTFFYISVALGATMVFAVGVYDDFKGASVGLRLFVELAAASIVIIGSSFFGNNLNIHEVGIPMVGVIDIGLWSWALTIVWIVGVTNALNIIDGLDGLAGGIAFIACFGVFAVALLNGQTMAMAALALLAGACLGFLRYNNHPAQVFLGDAGALLLGFLLACISVATSMKRHTSMALILPMQMLAVPLLDTIYSMSRRIVREIFKSDNFSVDTIKAMFKADRAHIHHTLLDVGFSHPKAVWVLYLLSTVIAIFGLMSALTLDDRVSLLFLLGGIAGFLVIRHFGASLPFIRRWKKVQDEKERPDPKECEEK